MSYAMVTSLQQLVNDQGISVYVQVYVAQRPTRSTENPIACDTHSGSGNMNTH